MSAPTILLFPGASLMDITPTTTGLRVRCPGCDHVLHMATAEGIGAATFVHADRCPVQRRIETARQALKRRCVRRG